MKIGIIGSGHIGSTLARLFLGAGHEVAIAHSGDPQSLAPLVHELAPLGRVVAATTREAAAFGPVVVLAVPFKSYRELPADAFRGKVVIDAENYYPDRDGHFEELDADRATSTELVQRQLQGARVVKAFNTIRWDHLRDGGRPAVSHEDRIGIPLASDDREAKTVVADLVSAIGFEPVDAGGLGDSRRQQPGSDIYVKDLPGAELQKRLHATA